MDNWVFSKKELNLIADLMVQKLNLKPNNSELSTMQLFREVLDAEYIEEKEGYCYSARGWHISDLKLSDGRFLHDLIKWDFANAVWEPGIEQGFYLDSAFNGKAIKAGYIVDGSKNAGLKLGLPYNITSFYRRKADYIKSFEYIEEELVSSSSTEKYYVSRHYETNHYHYEPTYHPRIIDYDVKRELQLWRIPVGCSTGCLTNENGRVTCKVLKGKCVFESSRWDYAIYNDNEEPEWKESRKSEYMKINNTCFSKGNLKRDDTEAPQSAWYRITNTGKSDLLLFVSDANINEYTSYAPLIGLSRLRLGTDGKGIRTLIAFYDCELNCKYCLNPQCKKLNPGRKVKYVSAKDIIETIKKDELYYLATNGGITLGGGEPLLHCRFLIDNFFKVYGKKWHVTVETSLHVTPWMLFDMAPYIDEYVVDIKDMNPDIYKQYTGKDNDVVKSNLRWLVENGKADHITVRLPMIPGFNTEEDRQSSKRELESMGITRFDLFTYKTNIQK